jgi:hypothetical protein
VPWAGALPKGLFLAQSGLGWSGRITFSRGAACAIGSTPDTSRALSFAT